MALVNVKYRVHCIESERGWGQKSFSVDFNTRVEAEAYMENMNARNNLSYVPDYYERANSIEMVEIV
jgi:hypothetical protein